MKISFKDAKIIAQGKYFEKAKYDMASDLASVVADGCGGLSSYRVANRAENFVKTFLSLDFTVGGQPLSPYAPKRVEMVGRTQKITVLSQKGDLVITTFLSPSVNGVFYRVEGAFPYTLGINARGAGCESGAESTYVCGQDFRLSSSVVGEWVKENDAFYLSAEGRCDLLISYASSEKEHKRAFDHFEDAFAATLSEIKEVKIPYTAQTEEEKALYLSAYFTAIQNHKNIGEFDAFAAGVNYMDPLRTYFRDSYFTVLPLLHSRPDLVRKELLTLSRGISSDGACPSAVKSDFTAFWGDHYDSPSFFLMELLEYVQASGDKGILEEKVNGRRVLDLAESVLTRLSEKADQTGLIYKEGEYNKRDWADEVNRGGYVTFVNVLYYRALIAASRLFQEKGDAAVHSYEAKAEKVKSAINDLLFDEEKGYYVNYKTKDFTEDNLSVDTVFALIFGVADQKRAARVLDNMERLLETKNNAEQEGEDFGVMCVYPPYKVPKGACHKSAHPYDYHNGANWCYLTAMYAYAKSLYGRDWKSPLLSTFRYYTARGSFTPVEYFSPCCEWGSALQGWSAAMAFAFECAQEWFN